MSSRDCKPNCVNARNSLYPTVVAGCSGSRDSQPPDSLAVDSTTTEPQISTTARVSFDITVPAFQSDALQVRLQWGDKDISAALVVAESWSAVDDFALDTENELVVTFNMENPDGVSGFSQIGGDLESSTLSFDHCVALYNRVNASYIVLACNTTGCVDSDAQAVTGTLDNPIGYFKASNTDSNDLFGDSVSLSEDGTTLAVGAEREGSAEPCINGDESNNSTGNAGAANIFTHGNGLWPPQTYIKSSNS